MCNSGNESEGTNYEELCANLQVTSNDYFIF